MTSSARALPDRPSPGAWLARQLERKGISVPQLAESLGVTEKTIYYWRNDKTTVSESRVSALAAALGISELEVRRGLGYWVPDDSEPQPARDTDELNEILEDLTAVLERFKRWRSEG